jgi:hypothetical protein
MKPPLTYEEYDKLVSSMEQLEALHVKQNELMAQLRRAYTMAHLVGVHPSELTGPVSLTHISNNTASPRPWQRASVRIRYTQGGVQQEKYIPLREVPLFLWEPEMAERYRKTLVRVDPRAGVSLKQNKGAWR